LTSLKTPYESFHHTGFCAFWQSAEKHFLAYNRPKLGKRLIVGTFFGVFAFVRHGFSALRTEFSTLLGDFVVAFFVVGDDVIRSAALAAKPGCFLTFTFWHG